MRFRNQVGRIVSPINRRCVAPPGELRPRPGRPILVASVMRSGTHLLIDLILNNFEAYRHNPLHLDLDRYFASSRPEAALRGCGAYVAKTHFPQQCLPAADVAALRRFADRAAVVRPVRELEATLRSQRSFGEQISREELMAVRTQADAFWGAYPVLELDFAELATPECGANVVERLADFVGLVPPARVVPNPPKAAATRILVAKLLTRLCGCRAPRVNTTIRFDSTR